MTGDKEYRADMRVSIRRAAVAAGGAAVFALVACSPPAAPEGRPRHLTATSVESLAQGCTSILGGYPDAAVYKGEGPHSIAIFARNLVSDAFLHGTGKVPELELANDDGLVGPLVKPDSPRDVELLACGLPRPGDKQLNSCTYSSATSLVGGDYRYPLYTQVYTFTVYELRTGRVVDTRQLESGTAPASSFCPGSVEAGRKVFAKAQPSELADLFADLVTGPPR